MKILYTSGDVHKAIKAVFDEKYTRRIAIVAYVGEKAESFLPSPKGAEIICCPEPGATSPAAIRSLIKRGAKVKFSNELHAKVYWSEGGCVITSANVSYRALARTHQKETGVLLDKGVYDIDRLIAEIDAYDDIKKPMERLEKETKAYKRAVGEKRTRNKAKPFMEWYELPYRESWKMGWWSVPTLATASAAKEQSKLMYNTDSPQEIINVAKTQVVRNDWLLCFEVSGTGIKNMSWMYIDFVAPVHRSEKGAFDKNYPFQAIQVHKLSNYPEPPFEIDDKFRTAFSRAVEEHGIRKIENRAKLTTPKRLLDNTAKYIK